MPVATAPRRLCALPLLLALAGCGGASVSGTVTYQGKAVEDGYISFQPADGKGTPVGAPIAAGKYTVSGLVAGKYKAQITGNRTVEIPKDDKDYARYAEGKKVMGDLVPPDAAENNKTVELTGGSQTIDFALKDIQRQ
jgi:hypothetical protein